jgi:two-component system response regulator NreC
MNLKLLLVDDHPMLRRGLRGAIAQRSDLTVVGEASTGEQAVKVAQETAPDVVVMDLYLPDMSGIEATRQILSGQHAAKIIIYSSDPARKLVDEAVEAGACGYVSKNGDVDELLQAIATVMGGKLYLSPVVAADILQDYRKGLIEGADATTPLLSERETQLIRLVADGWRNKEIADDLKISTKSVETYRARLMKKIGCASSAELVRYAIREGIAAA